MKGFGIEVKNTLLEPKHIKKMGGAIWLYLWLLDKVTSITEDHTGIVLGGRPIKYEEVKKELGISSDTYTRWIKKLEKYPYIEAKLAPYGIIFRLFKAHKRFRKFAESFRRSAEVASAEVRNVIKTISIDNNNNNTVVLSAKQTKVSFPRSFWKEISDYYKAEFKTTHGFTPSITHGVYEKMALEAIKEQGWVEKGLDQDKIIKELKRLLNFYINECELGDGESKAKKFSNIHNAFSSDSLNKFKNYLHDK